MQEIDWSKPQRQPWAGLVIEFIKTVWLVLKATWPFLIYGLLKAKTDESNVYDFVFVGIGVLAFFGSIIRFLYFRFYIANDELVIRKGWLQKKTVVPPLYKIQSVHTEQPFLHQLLGVVKLSVDTAGSEKTEAKISALHQAMAMALQERLLGTVEKDAVHTTVTSEPVLQLNSRDLLKLSLSANHLEAFFILLSFGYSIFDNIRRIDEDILPSAENNVWIRSVPLLLFLVASVLIVTVAVSALRIFFRFYHFTVYRTPAGFGIKSGLTNVKERLVRFSRIQFVSWRANWVRRKLNLWLLEYRIAGGDDAKDKMKVQVPVTRPQYIPVLTKNYDALPSTEGIEPVHIHSSFFIRRLLLAGMLPVAILTPPVWIWWGYNALLLLLLPLLVGVNAYRFQKKFRLWADADVLYIRRGAFGEEFILLKWYKLQSVVLKQSLYQRRRNLASLVFFTAGGNVSIPFIPLPTAQQLLNYALYQVEASEKSWM